jgi:serine/threonine-protein kinase
LKSTIAASSDSDTTVDAPSTTDSLGGAETIGEAAPIGGAPLLATGVGGAETGTAFARSRGPRGRGAGSVVRRSASTRGAVATLAGLEDHQHRVVQGDGAALLEVRDEIHPAQVLSSEVERPVGQRANVEDPRDMLGLELREQARFAAEELDLSLVEERRRERADHHPLVELGVRGLDQDAARAAQHRADTVFTADDVAGIDRVGAHSRHTFPRSCPSGRFRRVASTRLMKAGCQSTLAPETGITTAIPGNMNPGASSVRASLRRPGARRPACRAADPSTRPEERPPVHAARRPRATLRRRHRTWALAARAVLDAAKSAIDMTSNPDLPRRGDLIAGKYQVENVLGAGGAGVVLAARHLTLRQRVAIKLLLPQAMERPEAIPRFLREARAAAAIQSEHVARVLDVGILDDGVPYLVMEHLSGTDLARLLSERGPLPVLEVLDFILQASEAVAEAHSLGIVHRDLKPGNLFLATRADGSALVKVLDFGLSKTPDETLTAAGVTMGSPQYMPPEQLNNFTSVDQRADVWALGAILYRLLTGHYPFPGVTAAAIFVRLLTEAPRPMRAVRPEIPDELDAVVLGCLEKDLDRRIQSVAALARKLAPFAPPGSAPSLERIARLSIGAAPAPIDVVLETATTLEPRGDAVEYRTDEPIDAPTLQPASAPWTGPAGPPREILRAIRPPPPAPASMDSPSAGLSPLDHTREPRPAGPRGANALVTVGVGAAVIGILAVASILFVRHHPSDPAPAEASSRALEQPRATPPP